ncbi:hypothetical protein QUF88_07955 [Bacillus sp. DX1.1]|uniref:hypothetical protein n=1 Tax=unclassified Bacillus (in: firmicutes) TaxID=185979 RepID=UPI0025703978|nr:MULTISPECIES: hypothetical protein [unclassified Bacillus (in: firmicutes)]MDM5153762.1 hypothetical protein [Bacillus sp. DX1.1]WJE82699.1 hypothetical protein QRE67_05460 [Bacillus sp. DX3.1]
MKKQFIVIGIIYVFITIETMQVLFGKTNYTDIVNKLNKTQESTLFQSAKDGVVLLKGNIATEQPITDETKIKKEFVFFQKSRYTKDKNSWKLSNTEKKVAKHLSINDQFLPSFAEARFLMEPLTLFTSDITSADYNFDYNDTLLVVNREGFRYKGIENHGEALIFGLKKGNTLEGYKGEKLLIGTSKEEMIKKMQADVSTEKYGPTVWGISTAFLIWYGIYRFRKKQSEIVQ